MAALTKNRFIQPQQKLPYGQPKIKMGGWGGALLVRLLTSRLIKGFRAKPFVGLTSAGGTVIEFEPAGKKLYLW